MKKKKRKNTRAWLPRLREAIRKQEIWVRQTENTCLHKNGQGLKHYEIAIGADLFVIDQENRCRFYNNQKIVNNTWRIMITDDGRRLTHKFVTQDYKNANVGFTKDGERWFQETIGQIIAMYRMGAYRSSADDNKV